MSFDGDQPGDPEDAAPGCWPDVGAEADWANMAVGRRMMAAVHIKFFMDSSLWRLFGAEAIVD